MRCHKAFFLIWYLHVLVCFDLWKEQWPLTFEPRFYPNETCIWIQKLQWICNYPIICSKDFRIITTTTAANQSKIALKKDLHLTDLSGRLFEVLCFRVHTAVGTDIVISPLWFLDHAPNKTKKNTKLHIYFFHLITRPKPLIFIF